MQRSTSPSDYSSERSNAGRAVRVGGRSGSPDGRGHAGAVAAVCAFEGSGGPTDLRGAVYGMLLMNAWMVASREALRTALFSLLR